jgi:hypothetical protein
MRIGIESPALGIAATTIVFCALRAAQAAEPPVAHLVLAQQDVRVVRAGARWVAVAGRALERGDVIETGALGRAKLLFADGSVLNVGDGARVRVLFDAARTSLAHVDRGAVRFWVRTRSGAIRVSATHAEVQTDGGETFLRDDPTGTQVIVFSGGATLAATGATARSREVRAGELCVSAGGRIVSARAAQKKERAEAIEQTRVASRLAFDSVRRARIATGRVRRQVALHSVKASTQRKRKASQSSAPKGSGDLSSTTGAGGNDLDPLVPAAGTVNVTGRVGRRW